MLNSSIKALLVEEHFLFSSSLGGSLKSSRTIHSYESSNTVLNAKRMLRSHPYQLVIIDAHLRDSYDSGISLIRYVQRKHPGTMVLVLINESDYVIPSNIKVTKMTSLIAKNEGTDALRQAVENMQRGRNYTSPGIIQQKSLKQRPSIPNEVLYTTYNLTRREAEIVNFIITGYNNKVISDSIDIATSTLKKHFQNIYKKMNVRNKSELIRLVYDYDEAS